VSQPTVYVVVVVFGPGSDRQCFQLSLLVCCDYLQMKEGMVVLTQSNAAGEGVRVSDAPLVCLAVVCVGCWCCWLLGKPQPQWVFVGRLIQMDTQF
jgi:hypothetical protein